MTIFKKLLLVTSIFISTNLMAGNKILYNTSLKGDSFKTINNTTMQTCRTMCQLTTKCQGWSFLKSQRICYLKRVVLLQSRNNSFTSGLRIKSNNVINRKNNSFNNNNRNKNKLNRNYHNTHKEIAKLNPNKYKFLCEISTDGNGALNRYRVGGKYCAIDIKDFKSIIFQTVYGPVRYITAHERFKGGTWRTTYKGKMIPLSLPIVRKTNRSTHIILSVNGQHEKYLPLKTKVRVYSAIKNR